MREALALKDVSVVRGSRTVLRPLAMSIEFGSVLAILGPNGAGKTTLLEAMAGFLPFDGEILVDGASLRSLGDRERARKIAYVPQVSRLDSPMRVADVVGQGRFAHSSLIGAPKAEDDVQVARALAETNTTRFAERPFTALSHGERRRVLVARALATGAPIILLDEPSSALDISQSLALFELLRRLAASGCCVVVVLHVLDEAFRCADRSLLLSNGACAAVGPTPEVIEPETIRRIYGVELLPGAGLGYRLMSRAG
jgi:iron complex transport system ATP-binding protein